jgi:hypothetical protein
MASRRTKKGGWLAILAPFAFRMFAAWSVNRLLPIRGVRGVGNGAPSPIGQPPSLAGGIRVDFGATPPVDMLAIAQASGQYTELVLPPELVMSNSQLNAVPGGALFRLRTHPVQIV